MRAVISAIEQRLDEASAKGLASAVSRAIREGDLEAGQQLPPIRELAHQLALSPTTVSGAWTLLSQAGTIRTAGRKGTRVAVDASQRDGRYLQALDHRTTFDLDLSTGVPDAALLPRLDAAVRDLGTAGTPQSYLDDPVLPALRESLAADWPYAAPALAVVDGAMDALELLIRTLLRYGDRVVVEHPGFPPLLDLLEAAGVTVIGVRLDDEGMLPDALGEALAVPTQVVFLQPRAHNPTGIVTSARRLTELARVVAAHDVLVVEDDSSTGISTSSARSLGTHLPDRTVHIRSFSKAYGPDLRLAAVSGPAELIDRVGHLRRLGQGWSSRLLQRVLVNLLQDEQTGAALEAARAEYARRRRTFCDVLAAHGIAVPGDDGINVWVPVVDETVALTRLATLGIGVAPGRPFQVLEGDGGHVRVTVGLIDHDESRVATELASAALMGSRRGGR